MKIKEIRDLSNDELKQKERNLSEEFFKLRFRLTAGQLESHQAVKKARRDIARVKTVLRERGL